MERYWTDEVVSATMTLKVKKTYKPPMRRIFFCSRGICMAGRRLPPLVMWRGWSGWQLLKARDCASLVDAGDWMSMAFNL
jgi:hypothetical protein